MLDAKQIFEASRQRAIEKVAGVFVDQISDVIAGCVLSANDGDPDFEPIVPMVEKLSAFCVKHGGEATLVEDFDPMLSLQRAFGQDAASITGKEQEEEEVVGETADQNNEDGGDERLDTSSEQSAAAATAADGESVKIASAPEIDPMEVAKELVKLAVKKGKKLKPGSMKDGKSEPTTKAKPGEGGRFKVMTKKLSKKKGVKDPKALAASIARAKYGKGKAESMAAKGRSKAASAPVEKKDRLKAVLRKHL